MVVVPAEGAPVGVGVGAVTVPAVWLSYHPHVDGRVQWDGGRGLLGDLIRRGDTTDTTTPGDQPSVVLVPGQHHATRHDYAQLNADLARMPRAVVVVYGDEASLFDWRHITHPDLRWWVMTPRHTLHAGMPAGTRFIGEGAGPPFAVPPVEKDLDVFFAGQITHPRRQELADTLRPLTSATVVLEETPGFMQGRPRAGYLSQLARAKVAPCPSGIGTVDSFRLWESVRLGCVPVVEHRTPDGKDHGMWHLCYPGGVPFPVVMSWSELPGLLPDLLAEHETIARRCQDWWLRQRQQYAGWLAEDVAWLHGTVHV